MGLTQIPATMVKDFDLPESAVGDVLTFNGTHWVAQPGVPLGTILPFAGVAPPPGWLLCDGSEVNRASYAGLFAAIGTAYGAGDGELTFCIPDMRGRVAVGLDNLGGDSANRLTVAQADVLGGMGGSESHTPSGTVVVDGEIGETTLSVNQTPSHYHVSYGPSQYQATQYPTSTGSSTKSQYTSTNTTSVGGGQSHNHSFSGSGTLIGTSFDTTPPWLAMSYIIKV
ncbi:MAG: tail fiber protein [Blastochloris viridis]|uniref:Tail fiber protein n=1 Tax=Blastochloris viridis TaxID=1079 RepID=A0A6N4RF73_BLAVI|nr:MAG: tail fiber protein [Blastochloris viridis]